MQMAVDAKVREFIADNFLFDDDLSSLSDTESLTESGVIDSTGILELIAFLETEMGIEIKNPEIVPDNFDTVDNIINFTKSKLS